MKFGLFEGMLQVSLPHHEGYPSPREIVESRLGPYLTFPSTETVGTGRDEWNRSESGGQGEERPRVLFGSYFLADFYDDIRDQDTPHPNVFHAYSPSTELKEHVDKGRDIFSRMFPGEDFLPKAPHPQQEEVEMESEEPEDSTEDERNNAQNGF